MKEKELREHAVCSWCGNRIGSAGVSFFTVQLQQHIVNLPAINRQQGLAMMLGGNGVLASAMGPDEDVAHDLPPVNATLCLTCFSKGVPTEALFEYGAVEDPA